MSNENLDKTLDRSPSSVSTHQRPLSSSEIMLKRQLSERDKRLSAPLGERKGGIRDSVGSVEYLSDAPGTFLGRNRFSWEG